MSTEADHSRASGAAALGARLRRLSERIDREAARVYDHAGLHFEQRWMGVLSLLAECGAMSVGDLSQALGISHPSVSQTRRSLQEAGLVTEQVDELDARRRNLLLTPAGNAAIKDFRPIWAALIKAAEDLDRDAHGLIGPLNRFEDALNERSLDQRAIETLGSRGAKPESE